LRPTPRPTPRPIRRPARVRLVEGVEPRLLLAGDFDPTFGAGGIARADLSQQARTDTAADVLVQPDGKIVVGGNTTVPPYDDLANEFVVARFNADGTPDAAFGNGGVGRATFGVPNLRGVSLDTIALQPDGKIVAGGLTVEYDFRYDWNFALARFNPDGSVDRTFGDGGTVVFNFGGPSDAFNPSYDRVTALAVRPDGRIVAVGVSQTGYSDFALAQFNSDGTLDTTFGDAGKTRHVVGYVAWPTAAELLPDGKLVVAGSTRTSNVSYDPLSVSLTRYTPDGRPDPTFGVGGVNGQPDTVGATVDNIGPGGADDLVVDPLDGSLYVSAHAYPKQAPDNPAATQYLIHYSPEGRRDTTFGLSGLAYVGQVAGEQLASLAMDRQGRLVSAFTSGIRYTANLTPDFTWTLARHTRFGALDLSFGGTGVVTHAEAGPRGSLVDSESLPDGRLLVVGTDANNPANNDAILARFDGGSDAVAGAGVLTGTLFKDSDLDTRRGYFEPGVEGQSVYIDTDGDALHDAGEPVATSDASGRYRFSGLAPGTYTLRTLLTGVWSQTAAPAGGAYTWTLPAGGGLGGADFGLVQRPKITVFAFNDTNANGVADPGEPPLSGNTAYIDTNDNGLSDATEPRLTFGEDGTATFQVTPGTYRIRQTVPANFVQTSPGAGAHVVTVENENVSGFGFGSVSRFSVGRIEGFTYVDTNGNGTKESTETGVATNTVYIDADDDARLDPGEQSVVSDYRGFYQFPLMLPGTYTVRMQTSRGQVLTGPAGGAPHVVNLAGGQRATRDFGYQWEPNRVLGRYVFYNNSAYDRGGSGSADDNAIATDKRALLPGETASAANVTGYSRGINGIMIDVNYVRPNAVIGASSFSIMAGKTSNPATWTFVSIPDANVSVRRGAGVDGSDRITITLPDGRVRNSWMSVVVLENTPLALPTRDRFYFGNLAGETFDGLPGTTLSVTTSDMARTRAALGASAPITSAFDFNRDRVINAADLAIARSNARRTLPVLTAPAAAQAQSAPVGPEAQRPARKRSTYVDALASLLSGTATLP
jgi:uncharacterized delta-60 repeat protein